MVHNQSSQALTHTDSKGHKFMARVGGVSDSLRGIENDHLQAQQVGDILQKCSIGVSCAVALVRLPERWRQL
jgi:hypothetical protein